MDIDIRIIETREEFHALRERWNELVDHMEGSEAFFCWEWAAARLEHGHGDCNELFILAGEQDGKLVALAPLCIQRTGIGPLKGRVVRTITGDQADYGSFYLHREGNHRVMLAALLGVLHDHRHRWDVLHLFNFSSRNPQAFLLADLAESEFGMTCHLGERMLTPYFHYGTNDAKIARSRLKTIERRERALHRDHQVEIVIGGAFSEHFWKRFVALHVAKWPESNFRDPAHTAFLCDAIVRLEPLGKVEISWLKIDGELAAMHLGFKTAEKIGYYIPVADAKYQQQGIGGILLKSLIDHYAGQKREFDFLRGNEPYKFHWTDSVAANHHLMIGRKTARSRAVSAFLRAKDRLRGTGGLRRLARAATGR
jgi:CelD/BcsL family acetyltransferase involved in cellulose biosynthesis